MLGYWRQGQLLGKFALIFNIAHKNMLFPITQRDKWTLQGLVVCYCLRKHFLIDLDLRGFTLNQKVRKTLSIKNQ